MRTTFLWVVAFILVLGFTWKHEGTVLETTFSEDKVKFCITGDTGKKSEIQKKMTLMMEEERCDRIIILGDIIYPDGIESANDPQIKTKFEDYYLPLTQKDKKPKVALINGNHDYLGNPMAWVEVAKKKKWILMPSRYYMEDVSGFCFYYLDSNMFTQSGYLWVALAKIQWLQNVWKEKEKTCHTEISMAHHPYRSVGRHSDAKGYIKQFYEWFVLDRSDYLISGHAHLIKDFGKIGKTHLLISGAGGTIEDGYEGGLLILNLDLKNRTHSYYFKKME